MEKTRQFAYGNGMVGSCDCPAVAAGFKPSSDDSIGAAERYDAEVEKMGFTNPDSVIPEEQAKKAWIRTVEIMEDRNFYGNEVAREIAEELGWM